MNLPALERSVLDLLDQYRQLTTSQLRVLAFPDANWPMTWYRKLNSMYKLGLIDKAIQRRVVGKGGSGEYVWTLGRAGARLVGRQSWRRLMMNYHTLAVSDVGVRLRKSEVAGEFLVHGIKIEQEGWLTVQAIELRPDMLVELQRVGSERVKPFWIEVDLGTERQSRIEEKLTRYMSALRVATSKDIAVWPQVVFLSETDARRGEIGRVVAKLPEDQRKHFRSITLDSFPAAL